MAKQSAGILLYRQQAGQLQVFLVHQGGPFFAKKDAGYWTIPKGEYDSGEEPLAAALRELEEETGISVNPANAIALSPVKQKGGKTVLAWAIQYSHEINLKSNVFEMEWPPKSGRRVQFPEVDKGQWFTCADAMQYINTAQAAFITELEEVLNPR